VVYLGHGEADAGSDKSETIVCINCSSKIVHESHDLKYWFSYLSIIINPCTSHLVHFLLPDHDEGSRRAKDGESRAMFSSQLQAVKPNHGSHVSQFHSQKTNRKKTLKDEN
jgi:hypothetical protein